MKKLLMMAVMAAGTLLAQVSADVVGYWTTIDDDTNEAKSVVQVYKYKGKVYGRVVELLKNKNATAKIPGNPSTLGLDIIWDLEQDGEGKRVPLLHVARGRHAEDARQAGYLLPHSDLEEEQHLQANEYSCAHAENSQG